MRETNESLQFRFAIVTAKGLAFEGRLYTNSSMVKNKWFEQAEIEGEWYIPVLFQPSNHEQLILINDDSQEVATALQAKHEESCTDKNSYFQMMQILKERYFHRN